MAEKNDSKSENYFEELSSLIGIYKTVNDEEFSTLGEEGVKKLQEITSSNRSFMDDNTGYIIKFLQEQSALKQANNKKRQLFNLFSVYKSSWCKKILERIINQLSIPKDDQEKFLTYMRDRLGEEDFSWEEIFDVIDEIKNQVYLSYSVKLKKKSKVWHYIKLILNEIITIAVMLMIYGALSRYSQFENITVSILFLIYLSIKTYVLNNSSAKLAEIKWISNSMQDIKLLFNDAPDKKEKEEVKKFDTEYGNYYIDGAITSAFYTISYIIILYQLYIQLFTQY